MVKRFPRKLVQKFAKETSKHRIRLIAGIEPRPPDPHPNAIFYVRMKSENKKTGKIDSVEPIWLTLTEMQKLSMLMFVASRFWEERLEKSSKYSQERISKFIDVWKCMEEAIDILFP